MKPSIPNRRPASTSNGFVFSACQPQRLRGFVSLLGASVLVSFFAAGHAEAAEFYWRGGNNSWSTTANWAGNAGGGTAYNPADYGVVAFNVTAANAVSQTVTLNGARSIQGLEFSNSGTTAIIGDINRTLNLSQSITLNVGSGAVTIGSATGGNNVSVVLNSQTNTWTNNSSSTLTIQNNLVIGNWSPLNVTGPGPVTVHGNVSQAATDGEQTSIAKSGAGVLTLNGSYSSLGRTSVTGGALVINGNQNAATGAVSVSNIGTILAGSGTVGGNTTINSDAIHSAGALGAVGKQTFDKPAAGTTTLTYNSDSIFSWNLDRTLDQTRGVGYDAVDVSGTLGGTGAIFRVVIGDAAFDQNFWSTTRTWSDIFTALDGITAKTNWTSIFGRGFDTSVSTGSQGSFSFEGGNTLKWTPDPGATFVPEPTSALAGLLIGAGLLRRRRTL